MKAFALLLLLQTTIFQNLMQGPPATEFPPDAIWINGDVYDVAMVHRVDMDLYLPGAAGYTFCDRKLILIVGELPDEEMHIDVTHEILHAITCRDGGKAKKLNSHSEKNHEGIYYLAPKLAAVLEHNPRLLKWMMVKPQEKKP